MLTSYRRLPNVIVQQASYSGHIEIRLYEGSNERICFTGCESNINDRCQTFGSVVDKFTTVVGGYESCLIDWDLAPSR